ncbi:MAG: hypothetical protein RLN79_02365 [Cytophagales bacterium]
MKTKEKVLSTKIEKLEDHLISLVIGIRFRANFSIEDNIGAMVDNILYSKKAFFNPGLFSQVNHESTHSKILHDKRRNYLKISNTDIILEINLSDYEFSTQEYIRAFRDEIINGMLKKYGITQIHRIGFIKRYLFKDETIANNFIDRTIGLTVDGVNDINLTFSRKFPVDESISDKEIFDYNNVIYNIIKKADEDELFASIDYQRYYEPNLESVSEMRYDRFVELAENFSDKNFKKWLNDFYVK